MEELRARYETLRTTSDELTRRYQEIVSRLRDAQTGDVRLTMREWRALSIESDDLGDQLINMHPEIIQNLVEQRRISDDPLSVSIVLEGAYLNRIDLTGANLEGANLKNAELNNSILAGANLRGANLERVDLEDANLEGADLEGANLKSSVLSFANFEGANLHGAILTNVNIDFVELTEEQLDSIIVDDYWEEEELDEHNWEELDEHYWEEEELDEHEYQPMRGVAYEIHNAFDKFEMIKEQYLALINQNDVDIGGDIYTYIERVLPKI